MDCVQLDSINSPTCDMCISLIKSWNSRRRKFKYISHLTLFDPKTPISMLTQRLFLAPVLMAMMLKRECHKINLTCLARMFYIVTFILLYSLFSSFKKKEVQSFIRCKVLTMIYLFSVPNMWANHLNGISNKCSKSNCFKASRKFCWQKITLSKNVYS